jgi:multiple sugar transport system ATP-binding protein
MASIRLTNVTKEFGGKAVVDGVSLEVKDKEFLVLLGPSGCGKSTLLRMLAGLEKVSSGTIEIDGKDATHLEPKERDLAFVFQSYALYPHMTVRRNISFPLLMREFKWWFHVPIVGWLVKRRLERSPEISETVDRVAHVLELDAVLKRLPKTLSGGQRQRVAVGRAMVREPVAFLMDEPLSNLDAKLRVHMRSEISKLHRTVDKTFVYVTHDQTEAMTMGSRIVVLRDGVLLQQDEPQVIFQKPANVFVARFIGSPPMNIIQCQVVGEDSIGVYGSVLPVPQAMADIIKANDLVGSNVLLGVRPECVGIIDSESDGLSGVVEGVEHLGSETLVSFKLIDPTGGVSAAEEPGGKGEETIARVAGYATVTSSVVGVRIELTGACLFDCDTELRLSEVVDGHANRLVATSTS